jgi:prevent-host-death family protein
MEPTKVTATELRLKTRDLVERVRFKGEHVLIENFGRPMVVIISFEDYMQVKDSLTSLHSSEMTPPRRNGQEAVSKRRRSNPDKASR